MSAAIPLRLSDTFGIVAVLLVICLGPSSARAMDAPHDSTNLSEVCGECHVTHNSFGSLLDPSNGNSVDNLCLSCHYASGPATAVMTHVVDGGALSIACTTCHDPHTQSQNRDNGSTYGKLLRTTIAGHDVVLLGANGPHSMADDDTTIDGVCEVCHTTTTHHTNDPNQDDSTGASYHYPQNRCTSCHRHTTGFTNPADLGGSHLIQRTAHVCLGASAVEREDHASNAAAPVCLFRRGGSDILTH